MPHALTMSLVNVMKRWRSTKKCWLVQTSTTHTKKQREGYARRSKQSRLGSRKQNSSCHAQITQITPIYEICVICGSVALESLDKILAAWFAWLPLTATHCNRARTRRHYYVISRG